MDPAYYVAAGSLKARAFHLDVISNNLANLATTGFKPEQTFFRTFNKTLASGRNLPMSSYVNDGTVLAATKADTNQGSLRQTHRKLDVALEGNGFFVVQTPAGIRVTRDGRFRLGPNGRLEAMDGSPVLGKNGQPIPIDPAQGDLSISEDGSIWQKNQQIGILDLKAYQNPGAMPKDADVRFDPIGAQEAPLATTVHQGFVEQSTVDATSAIVELIRINRLFEMSMKVAQTLTTDLDGKSISDIANTR